MTARDVRSEAGVSIGELYGVFRRRMWWFLLPTSVFTLGSLVIALALPPEYEAAATVTVEPQVIPPDLAPSTIAARWAATDCRARRATGSRDPGSIERPSINGVSSGPGWSTSTGVPARRMAPTSRSSVTLAAVRLSDCGWGRSDRHRPAIGAETRTASRSSPARRSALVGECTPPST